MIDLLEQKPTTMLDIFLSEYSAIQKIDIDKAKRIIKESVIHYKKGDSPDMEFKYLSKLETLWYSALKKGKINYDVYDDDYYFTDLWNCWVMYSRQYLRDITNYISLFKNVKGVVDLGCGIGYTTAALKQLFPKATVYGTNLETTKQYEFCKFMGEKYNFTIVPDISYIKQKVDIIFASEYFEHILNPNEHLYDIIDAKHPEYLIIANSFNTYGIGHFTEYSEFDHQTSEKDISKIFNGTLRYLDYIKLKTNIWNNKPTIWIKNHKAFPKLF